jgi:hypothetical protein
MNSDYSTYLKQIKNMSWADIYYLVEEAEERKKLDTIVEIRKRLVEDGKYQLEEGEILE